MLHAEGMTQEPSDPEPARRRRRGLVLGGIVLVAAIAAGTALVLGGDDEPAAEVTVVWGGSEGHPACVYDPASRTVEVTLLVDGTAPEPDTLTVTVTAYADENTSKEVGSSTRSVDVEGTVHMPLLLTVAVERAPYVDVDGVAACRLEVSS